MIEITDVPTIILQVMVLSVFFGAAMALWETYRDELAARKRLAQLRRIDWEIGRKERLM